MDTDVKTKSSRGKILRLFRIARDMSIKELAEKMQVSSSYISDVERGVRNPSMETCKKYSDAFGVLLSVIIFYGKRDRTLTYFLYVNCYHIW